MTNRVALVMGLLILGGLALDLFYNGSGHVVFLGKRFYELIEWLAFWR